MNDIRVKSHDSRASFTMDRARIAASWAVCLPSAISFSKVSVTSFSNSSLRDDGGSLSSSLSSAPPLPLCFGSVPGSLGVPSPPSFPRLCPPSSWRPPSPPLVALVVVFSSSLPRSANVVPVPTEPRCCSSCSRTGRSRDPNGEFRTVSGSLTISSGMPLPTRNMQKLSEKLLQLFFIKLYDSGVNVCARSKSISLTSSGGIKVFPMLITLWGRPKGVWPAVASFSP
mmetsp:Transcript_6998/g.20444  ORF Transcript_6998/g.20444 Transcript_6998/m.20444 type:complete len:227 (+) Transcript_6998:22-702(+)